MSYELIVATQVEKDEVCSSTASVLFKQYLSLNSWHYAGKECHRGERSVENVSVPITHTQTRHNLLHLIMLVGECPSALLEAL